MYGVRCKHSGVGISTPVFGHQGQSSECCNRHSSRVDWKLDLGEEWCQSWFDGIDSNLIPGTNGYSGIVVPVELADNEKTSVHERATQGELVVRPLVMARLRRRKQDHLAALVQVAQVAMHAGRKFRR